MLKKLYLILLLIICGSAAQAQIYSAKNLAGRWQSTRHKNSNMIFTSDSTGAWIDSSGFISNRFKYKTSTQKRGDQQMDFKFTIQLNRKKPSYDYGYIKFLNDSIFLIRLHSWSIPKDTDTSNKKVSVFRKITTAVSESDLRYATYNDLIGVWSSKLKDTSKFQKFTFVDTNTLYIQTSTQGLNKFRYVVDFKKQPITVDVYYQDKLAKQCFIGFYSKDIMRLEHFDPHKRKDHFTFFGGNAHLYREKATITK
jgi:hypothetical protein